MTCIAWDGKTLAADRRACLGTMVNTITKIWRVNDVLVGGSGEACFIGGMVEWVRNGRKLDEFPAYQRDKDDWQPFIVIESDGTTSLYERTPHPVRYEQSCLAIGSGREFARAAMHLGLDARAAVQVAIDLDSGCGGGIDTLSLQAP